ncbi:Cache 3/Cache 2 fusion domain-containing protein [Dyella acidisoli]|uniref:Methyl-accepting chemotaxis protein n=1 Tax=Dyella acidisoli TaxID=1867834 RepID=A0ABQ5XVH7_9GAMM|nr:Cache 3/Cache 2 fusion domain-containing protein [Dyella acidisoli]GLQ94958.1 methyl-accepting chemotaxis protein [Dyella acidisoli]
MFKDSLRARLLLPVLALGLAAVIATAAALAFIEANRVRTEAQASIDSQTTGLKSLFGVTHSIMLERVHSAMRLLRQEGEEQGAPSPGQPISVGSREANDLVLGGKPQGNSFQLVDNVTSIMGGTATLFSTTGDDFVRVSTNVKKDNGMRAIGTVLDPHGPVIGEIRQGRSFYGVVDILGSPYVTGYEPIYDHANPKPIGIWYVGYKTDLEPLDKVISNSHVLESGFVALLDSKGTLRFHSKTGATVDPAVMTKIVQEQPSDWTVQKSDVPDWGFTLVAAYPNSDINSVIVRQTLWIALLGLLICLLLLGLQYVLIQSRVLQPIQRLTEVADALSMGKLNNIIEEVKLKDEIGTLAKAIARLSNSVRLAMERLSKR